VIVKNESDLMPAADVSTVQNKTKQRIQDVHTKFTQLLVKIIRLIWIVQDPHLVADGDLLITVTKFEPQEIVHQVAQGSPRKIDVGSSLEDTTDWTVWVGLPGLVRGQEASGSEWCQKNLKD